MITNKVTIAGSTPSTRLRILQELCSNIAGGFIELDVKTGEALNFECQTGSTPLSNNMLDLAISYLGLDFKNEFSYHPANWTGYITVTDGEVVYCCNYIKGGEPIPLGNMYSLLAEGGFPHCLDPYLD